MRIAGTKIKVLNAFAGFGGNTELWDNDKFQVTHVENDLKRVRYLVENFFEDHVEVGDAYRFIENHFMNYDIIWASPPCQSHSNVRWANRSKPGFKYKIPDMRLYGLIYFLERACLNDRIWIVENVEPYYKPLIEKTSKVGRHIIWSNRYIYSKKFEADNIINQNPNAERDKMNPEIGKYIIDQVLDHDAELQQLSLEEEDFV